MIAPLKNWWNWWASRTPREQSILVLAAIMIAAALVYWLVWQPSARGIRQLQAELPELRKQHAELQAMAIEAQGLRAQAGQTAAVPAAERLAAVKRSLQRAGLAAEVAAQGETRVRVRVADVDYAVWAAWLAAAEGELGARTARASVAALEKPDASGRVRVELELDFSPSAAGTG
jgi:general secretion pathway protein M